MLYHNRYPAGNSPAAGAVPTQDSPLKRILNLSILMLAVAAGTSSAAGREATGSSPSPAFFHRQGPGYGLYRGISQAQSDLAHQALAHAYSANPKAARGTLQSMRKLESEASLPPLSHLLSVAVDVMRYQNGDFADPVEEKALLRAIEEAADQGRSLCEEALLKQENHPTYLLILGGIRGFLATLKIQPDPSKAMSDGFQALKLLEKAREKDPRMKDCYMGTGMFHCTAANAPLFVRATLKIIGRSVNMRAGLEALRVSAYEGQYTSVASQLYLIQFLSPYEEEIKREKRQVLFTLEKEFPRNPYFAFLKADEALSFYPDSFFRAETRHELERRMAAFRPVDWAGRRFAELVKRQYALLNPDPLPRQRPDTTFDLRDFRYYPVFLQAVAYKRQAEDSLGADRKPPSEVAQVLKGLRTQCLDLLAESPMSATRRRHYEWHVTDALRWKAPMEKRPEGELQSVTESKPPQRERRGR
ncbi:MAG TPA: hypothetical protein VK465_05415 [Fibrobacteria bacterium]|nr:hypothetical protein [Fibrobacteria bacterium]